MDFIKKIKKVVKLYKLSESMSSAEAVGGDPEDPTFRRLTGRSLKDLPQYTHERMLNICYWLYRHNLLAKRILEIQRDFIVGDGITFIAEDENTLAVLESFGRS